MDSAAWWRDAVIYHVYLPSVCDANGDGLGDLQGLISRLPYFSERLGIDAIWVSPFFQSPWRDGGYDIQDHCAVDSRFGDLTTFDRLLAEAHRRKLRVIIDYVPNHTSDQHPWFLESRSSRDNPKRDWYVWADARPGETLPSNWISEAGGSTWEWDEATGQFYLHSHVRQQPDLNWRNPDVRDAMFNVLRFWLDRGVDGFRVDVAHMLMKDPDLRDNPSRPDGELNQYDFQHPDFTTQWHVHDRRHPDLHGVLRSMRAVLDEYGDRVAIGEIEVMPWADWATYYGDDLDELHMPLNFRLIETPWKASDVRAVLEDLQAALPEGGWPVNNLGNHDRSRIASRYGAAQARIASMLMLTARGTPLLYYGDELGMTDVDVPRELIRDGYADLDGGPTRDPSRTPMLWSVASHAGFAPTSAKETWLPIGELDPARTVAGQLEDKDSPLRFHIRLLALRRSHRALREGDLEFSSRSADGCLVYERRWKNERLLVALNFTDADKTCHLPSRGSVLLSTLRRDPGESVDGSLRLRGDEGVVVKLGR